MRNFFFIIVVILLVGCFNNTTTAEGPVKEREDKKSSSIKFFNSSEKYPFSEAVIVDNVIYLSGKIGTDPSTGELVEGGIIPETKQIMDNIKNTLTKMDSSMDNIFKCTCMLADISEWKQMSDVYRTYFKDNLPSRSAFAGSGLALGARVEIECWAIKTN